MDNRHRQLERQKWYERQENWFWGDENLCYSVPPDNKRGKYLKERSVKTALERFRLLCKAFKWIRFNSKDAVYQPHSTQKEQFSQKWKRCHHLLTPVPFHITFLHKGSHFRDLLSLLFSMQLVLKTEALEYWNISASNMLALFKKQGKTKKLFSQVIVSFNHMKWNMTNTISPHVPQKKESCSVMFWSISKNVKSQHRFIKHRVTEAKRE